MTKTCSVCGNPIGSLTRTGMCKKCYDKKYREEHKQDIEAKAKANARAKKWQKDNPARANARAKKWRDDNPEKARARGKKYRDDNSEKVSAARVKYREENPEKAKAARDKYREENPDNARKIKQFTIIEIDGVQFNIQVRVNTKTGHVGTMVGRLYKERAADRAAQWRINNLVQATANNKQWQKNNPEKKVVINNRWLKNNPDKPREYRHERRTYLSSWADCDKLNPAFPGCDAHHVDPDTIMHIPESLHKLISHSLKTGEGMEEMNHLAFDWLKGVRAQSPQTTL